MNNLITKFQNSYQSFFTTKDIIILALSGGSDSIFLGEMLFQSGFKNIIAAHFHHNLRGQEADDDEKFCYNICQKWNFEFISEKWQKPQKSEEKCRRARYQFLEKILKIKHAQGIFLAHHKDDQVETIFFNFLRGTGVKGLRGMKKWDKNRKFFRPLLEFKKNEIINFLQKNKLIFKVESTNLENKYARNFLRNKIFPILEEKFPYFKTSVQRSSLLFAELDQFLKQEAQRWIKENKILKNGFALKKFFILETFLQKEIIRIIFSPFSLDFLQINEIINFLKNSKSGKKIELRGKIIKVFADNFFIENNA